VIRLVQLADSGLSAPDTGYGGPQVMRGLTAAADAGVSLELEPRQQRVYASVEARFQISEPTL
jgi:hypothetical protein